MDAEIETRNTEISDKEGDITASLENLFVLLG
jgi:hypothetical protein